MNSFQAVRSYATIKILPNNISIFLFLIRIINRVAKDITILLGTLFRYSHSKGSRHFGDFRVLLWQEVGEITLCRLDQI